MCYCVATVRCLTACVYVNVLLCGYSPVFDGLFDFCSMYTGASLEGAYKLNNEVTYCLNMKQSIVYLHILNSVS